MAVQTFGTNDQQTVKRWAVGAEAETLKKCYAMNFAGRNSGSLLQIRDELSKAAGDLLKWHLRVQLEGEILGSTDTFEGNEDTLTYYQDSFTIDEVGKPVRWKTQMDAQRVTLDQLEEAKEAVADFMADYIDTAFFNQVCGYTVETRTAWTGNNSVSAPDTDHVLYPSGVTSDDGLTSAHIFTLDDLDVAIERAKTLSPALRPIKHEGRDLFICFIHPYNTSQLRADGTRWDDIQMAKLQGGYNIDSNPLFTGALGVYNGVVLIESSRVTQGVHGSEAEEDVRRPVLCGAQAAVLGWGRVGGTPERFKWVEKVFDYDREQGIAASMIWGLKKSRYNSKDYGTIVIPRFAQASSV